jgi:phosphoribosylaminoimidazole-succinocarboxamide synthase
VSSDTITAVWGTDAAVKSWDYFSDKADCVVSATFSKSASDSMDQTDETYNGKYICLYAEDSLGNAATLVSDHDINIDAKSAIKLIGQKRFETVKSLSIDIYKKGAEYADEKGIIIADTKFEFGIVGDDLILIDEILTPDSSRFWPKMSYRPGGPQKSFDKQYVRDYLISINYDKKPPGPSLPEDVITNTRNKYLEAFNQLTAA